MDPMAAGHALVRALPPNTTVVDEAITTGFYVRGFHHWTEPGHYFFCKGGGLGWGMPAALGVSLGHDREPVLCVVGDGSAMYSPQALWTAAHERLPVVFAVVNNRQYLILKGYLRGMSRDSVQSGRMVAMDIDEPPVDFVGLARSMGVDCDARREGRRCRRRGAVGARVRATAPARAAHRRTVTAPHGAAAKVHSASTEMPASPSICAASAWSTTASSPSTGSTGACRPASAGSCSGRTDRERRRWFASCRSTCIRREARCACSAPCSGRSTSARCGHGSASRARRWRRCCGARSRSSTS